MKYGSLPIGLGMAALGLAALVNSPARAEVTDNESIPFTQVLFVPCAADGAGEEVLVSGDLHILTSVTMDQSGGGHLRAHVQPQGISGVGLTTGDKYQATGGDHLETNFQFGREFTEVSNFRLIGQGPGNNFLVHQTIHFTINANGTLTTDVNHVSAECK